MVDIATLSGVADPQFSGAIKGWGLFLRLKGSSERDIIRLYPLQRNCISSIPFIDYSQVS